MLVLRLFQKEEFWTCFKQEHIYYIYICRTEQSKTTNSSQVKWSDTGTLADAKDHVRTPLVSNDTFTESCAGALYVLGHWIS